MDLQHRIPILVLGASGHLGSHIVKELCAHTDKFSISILVKDPTKCPHLCEKIKETGGKIFNGDVTEPVTIDDITKGIHTVISALEGNEETLIKGQLNVLRDGIKHAIKRFVPSCFSLNVWNLPKGTNIWIDQIKTVRELIEKEDVTLTKSKHELNIFFNACKSLYFTNGVIMETLYTLIEKEGFIYWGDENRSIDLTSLTDIAKFVVEAVRDPDLVGDVMISGCEMKIKQILEVYNQITGKNIEAKNLGTIGELKTLIKSAKQQGNIYEALKFEYYLMIFGEETKIQEKMNKKFPNVKGESFEDFLNKHKGKHTTLNPMLDLSKLITKEALARYSS